MRTMNVSLPDSLKSFVDEQVSACGYSTSSEYVRQLIRKDQDRQRLRGLLLEGAASRPTAPSNTAASPVACCLLPPPDDDIRIGEADVSAPHF